MPEKISEKNWKPINMNRFSAATAISEATGSSGFGVSNAVTKQYNWYQRLVSNVGKRRTKLQRYDQMDITTDIARALDVIAEDVSSVNADAEEPFDIIFDENDNTLNKTTMKTIQTMKNRWMKRTGLDTYFYDYVREAAKYGTTFLHIQPDNSLKYLVPERIHGYILDANDDAVVSHYLYNDKGNYKNKEGDDIGSTTGTRQDYVKIPVEELVIIKIGDGPFGQSVLDRVFKVWRQLQLLEDSIVIYRVVRAPERRVFYIDIGSMPAHKAESYIERMKIKMRQSQTARNNDLTSEYDPHSMQEDFFIPQTGDGRGSKIDTLQGGENLGELQDLQYFNRKLALGLRIPPGYMDTYSQEGNQREHNDGRVGSLFVAEMRYLGFVRRLQKRIAEELFHNFKRYCKKNEVAIPEEGVEFVINEPQSFALYKEAEKNQMLLNVQNSSDNIRGLSKRFSMKKFLQLSEEELVENEHMVLKEKGLTDEEIKGMQPEIRYNIVYGTGGRAKKAGIDLGDEEEGGGGFGRF